MGTPARWPFLRWATSCLLICAAVALPGCAPRDQAAVPDSPPDAPSAAPTESTRPDAASSIAWLDTELTDAVTGETFTLADYKGKPVLLHAFAVW